MTFSTDMDQALLSMTSGQRAAVKSAFTDLQTAVEDEQVAYGAPATEKIAFKDSLITLARELAAQMQ